MKQLTILLLVFIGMLMLLTSYSKKASLQEIPPTSQKLSYTKGNYSPTKFTKDTTALWMAEGSMESDTVLIMGDGGPKNQLDYEYDGKIAMSYLKRFKNYYAVSLHQSSTYNPEIFNWKDEFTMAMARKEVDNSSEIMHQAITYFKNKGKYVIVYGHSYSAFVIPHSLATKTSRADRYLITGGRIKADSLQTVYQLKNINTSFKPHGKSIEIPDENRPPNPNRTRRYFKVRQAKNYLKAAIGQVDFSQVLANKDLSNWTFLYGLKDQNVGLPTPAELEFLKAKKVQVIAVDSDHYQIYRQLVDDINEGNIRL